MTVRVGDLFAGIGGFALATKRMGWETAWFSEIHPYACKVLAKHFPSVPNHGDITKIDFTRVEPVEVLCGGFPCQDISYAGKGAGIEGTRSGLWSHYVRAIGVLRPRVVVVENVAALLGRGLERVLGDLAALRYDAEWHCIPASYVGAPHRRDRVWVVAYPNGLGCDQTRRTEWDSLARPRERGTPGGEECLPPTRGPLVAASSLADSLSQRGCGGDNSREDAAYVDAPGEGVGPGGGGGWWAVEPDVGRVANGVPARVDRLFGLGNAVVPQIPEAIFRAIIERGLV